MSLAALSIARADAGLDVDLGAIPPSQWDIYFAELRPLCPDARTGPLLRRPGNALNVEIGAPMMRCLQRSPDGRGLAWMMSGGSLLAYGLCTPGGCPRTAVRS